MSSSILGFLDFHSCQGNLKALVLFQTDMQTQSGNVCSGDSAHQKSGKVSSGVFPDENIIVVERAVRTS